MALVAGVVIIVVIGFLLIVNPFANRSEDADPAAVHATAAHTR